MISLVLATLLAAPLPEGTARYRFELSGEHVGVVELAISCAQESCAASFTSERRAPAEAGGRRASRRVEVTVDREGRFRGGRLRAADDDGAHRVTPTPDAVPAMVAEVVLSRLLPLPPRKGWQSYLPAGPEVCVEVFDEWTGEPGRACARRAGEVLTGSVLGAAETIVPGADGFPARIEVPGQAALFVRDAEATAPREAPRLHGTTVPGPDDPGEARSFCGVERDPDPAAEHLDVVPEPRAEGATCRDKAAAWLARAARAGLPGRTAVGVAWDGARFVWHAWAEVRLSRGWIPVDPAFGERPARGPRFTLATFAPGDPVGQQRAGERILACWARERVR